MTRRPIVFALSATLLLTLLFAVAASANLISYSTWPKARWDKLMVMNEDGSDPVELLVMSRGSFATGGSVSPVGLAETWILFNDLENIYKIRPDGTDQTLVLCAPGPTHPYGLGDPIWSPDGSEILVTPYDESHPAFLALIPANYTAGEDCSNEWNWLEISSIYEISSPWALEWGPAWNHDGSRIAFTEWNVATEESHLVVIERQPSGSWERLDPPIPVHLDFSAVGLSWRPLPESGLLIFRQRDDYLEPGVCCWLGSVDLETGEWSYVLDGGNPIPMHVGSLPKWSSDGEEILYTDPEGDLVIWSYLGDSRRTVGTGTWADWQRDALDLTCTVDADCDDLNGCTDNTCDAASGTCIYPPNYDPCDDGDSCTTDDSCDENGACSGTTVADGASCGTGSYCCSGQCAAPECVSDTDCDDDEFCTLDSCVDWQNPCAANCQYAPNPDPSCACLPKGEPCSSGDECCSGSCHPIKGTCK